MIIMLQKDDAMAVLMITATTIIILKLLKYNNFMI